MKRKITIFALMVLIAAPFVWRAVKFILEPDWVSYHLMKKNER